MRRFATTLCALALTAVLLSALLVLPAIPGNAAGAPVPRITLVAQPAWTPVGGDTTLRVQIDGDPAGLQIKTIVHSAVTSRSQFDQTVKGDSLGNVVASTTAAAAALPVDGATRVLTLGLARPDRADPARLDVSDPGVYPVDVQLEDPTTGQTLDHFVTDLVVARTGAGGALAAGQPLRMSWVWQIVADPAYLPDGHPDPAVESALTPTGRLGNLAAGLTQSSDIPLTLALGPETLESWSALARTNPTLASGLENVRAAGRRDQVLAGPYVPVDAPALERSGLGAQTSAQLAAGADTLGSLLGRRIDPRTVLADPIDTASLSRLRESGVDRLVVQQDAVSRHDAKFTTAQPFTVETGGRTFAAAVADPGLEALLDADGPPALRAQQFLAALAVIQGEQPNLTRGVVVAMPARWNPSADLVTAVVAGLRGDPTVQAVPLDTMLDTIPPEGGSDAPTTRDLVGQSDGTAPVTARAFNDASAHLDAFSALVGPDDVRVARGEHTLLVALSAAWTGTAGRKRAAAELRSVSRSIDDFVSRVHVPGGRTVTLTARRAQIPLSFLNATGRSLKVVVSLKSDRLLYPHGASQIVTLAPRNTTVRVEVDTRSSGTFPLTVAVTSVDGRIAFQQTRYTVRSTVVSDVGLVLTGGAGLFLAVWWLLHARRRRRDHGDASPVGVPA